MSDSTYQFGLKFIWQSKVIRYNLILVCLYWFFSSIMNYTMNFYIKYIDVSNIFLLAILASLLEAVSKIFNGSLVKTLGYRPGTLICLVTALISSVLYLGLSSFHGLVIYLVLVLKLAASSSFASMYLTSVNLFPTIINVTSFNISSICGKVGAIIAPLVAEMKGNWPIVIILASSILSILAVVLYRMTREVQSESEMAKNTQFNE